MNLKKIENARSKNSVKSNNFVHIFSCASETAIGKNCHEIPGDHTQNYPNCCPRFECDDETNEGYDYGSNTL